MSMGSQIAAFFRDVKDTGVFWTIEFAEGEYIKWENEDSSEIFPLWSTESRVKIVLDHVDEFKGAKPVSFTFNEFCEDWVPSFNKDKVSIGPNWAGENLTGTSMSPAEIINRIQHQK